MVLEFDAYWPGRTGPYYSFISEFILLFSMDLNSTILKILSYVHEFGNLEVKKYLTVTKDEAIIKSSRSTLVKIDQASIMLPGSYNAEDHILIEKKEKKNTVLLNKLRVFLKELSPSIIRLNHIGIGYTCKDPKIESKKYCETVVKSNFKLYEEQSINEFVKWYFIADLSDCEPPIFEIVLTKSKKLFLDDWNPHFHIDIDTNLSPDELKELVKSVFGTEFDWVFDTPDWGFVMGMKLLGSVGGTKIWIGVSTKIRNVKYHRENLLKDISVK